MDRTIAEIAAANGGRYSVDLHLRHDPSASESFAETHVRRLEAMRRLTGNVVREADGTWIIAADHLEQAAIFERRQAKDVSVVVQTLSSLPLDRQVGADGATWLDRELLAATPEPLRELGFGKDVLDAQVRRRQWLIVEGLAREEQGRVVYRGDMLDTLRRRELVRVAGQLSDELGLGYVETGKGGSGGWRLSPGCRSRKWQIRRHRKEPGIHPGSLAAGTGTTPRPAGVRRDAWGRDFVDHRPAAERAEHVVMCNTISGLAPMAVVPTTNLIDRKLTLL